jgi:hypothetical protein
VKEIVYIDYYVGKFADIQSRSILIPTNIQVEKVLCINDKTEFQIIEGKDEFFEHCSVD